MTEAPFDRPEEIAEILHPLFVSPDGHLGYVKIHKCGTNSFARPLRKAGWGRAWSSARMYARGDYVPSPNPAEILVIVRDPVERYISGLVQVSGSDFNRDILQRAVAADGVYHHNLNQHLWPFTWFLQEWRRFEDRFQFVDIHFARQWFEDHGVELPEDTHRNINPRRVVEKYTAELVHKVPAIRAYYHNDYRLLAENGLFYS